MKENFFGFYPPTEIEIDQIWKDSIIVFDANTLLNLYRYSKTTKDDFIKTIKEYSERIWLPYQAGYEFHSNRISVIKSQEEAYSDISNKFDEVYKKVENELNQFKRHPFINVQKILAELSKKNEKIKKDLLVLSEKHPEYLKNDEILPDITELFEGKIGRDFSENDLEQIYKEGKERYEKKIPPGFSDLPNKKNRGNRKLFGDLIIWKQLIAKSKATKKTMILVTDDRKEDWWHKFKGQTIRPREELIKEFYDETGFRILIYQADSFLTFAKAKLDSKVKDASIKEVKQVRLEDELEYNKENKSIISTNVEWWDKLNNVNKVSANLDWLDKLDNLNKVSANLDWIDKLENLNNVSTNLDWLDKLDKHPIKKYR